MSSAFCGLLFTAARESENGTRQHSTFGSESHAELKSILLP